MNSGAPGDDHLAANCFQTQSSICAAALRKSNRNAAIKRFKFDSPFKAPNNPIEQAPSIGLA